MNQPIISITNANLYAPEHLGLKNLLIAGGKIVAISDEPWALPPQISSLAVDLQGKRLLPGFIDSHAHITGGGGEAGFATQVPPVPISEVTGAGITTVVGLLGTDDLTRSIGNLVARAYALREEGMSAYCWTGGYHYPLTTLTGSAKADITYLDPVIGIGEFAISDHRSSQPTFDEVIRLASEAHVAGLMTGKAGVIHFHLGDGDRKLALIERALKETELPARTINPTHVNRNKALFESACQLLGQGCYIDISACPAPFCQSGWSAAQAITLAHERHLPLDHITISSDGGGCLPNFDLGGCLTSMDIGRAQMLADTLKQLLGQGLPLDTVLPVFTSNVADLLRLNNKGRLKVGYDADLVVLDEHDNICDVMALGRWHKRDYEMCIKGTFE